MNDLARINILFQIDEHTNCSDGSNFKYFFINSEIQPMVLLYGTVHFFFFIMGALPLAFSNTSTVKIK